MRYENEERKIENKNFAALFYTNNDLYHLVKFIHPGEHANLVKVLAPTAHQRRLTTLFGVQLHL